MIVCFTPKGKKQLTLKDIYSVLWQPRDKSFYIKWNDSDWDGAIRLIIPLDRVEELHVMDEKEIGT